MSNDDTEKDHEATAKKLEDLREKGQILRSKDLSSGLILAAAIIVLVFMSSSIKARFEQNFYEAFVNIGTVLVDQDAIFKVARILFLSNLYIMLPLFSFLTFIAYLSPFMVGGWNFSMQAISFKISKLNPITNLGNIFSKKMFTDIAKSLLKFSIIMGFFYYYTKTNRMEIVTLPYLQFIDAFVAVCSLIERFVLVLFIGIAAIIAIDVLTSFFQFKSKTMMSTQEMKDEYKNTEGNVDVKRKIKSLQMALLKQRIPELVPQANVIITNPTHYAVALKYKEGVDKAPKVIAKGKGDIAAYIKKLAIANHVPIYNEPPLARAIFHTTKTGGMVNPALYMAVAFVLTYINQLRRYQSGLAPMPVKSNELNIPDEFIFKG